MGTANKNNGKLFQYIDIPWSRKHFKDMPKIFQGAQPLAVVDHAQRKLLDHAVCNAKFIKNNNRYRTFEKMPD